MTKKKSILCLASYEKGQDFLSECSEQGWEVHLVTGESLRHANWPWSALKGFYCVPDPDHEWHVPDLIKAVSYLARTTHFDKIVALDDFDVEKGGALREHLRIEGMGETTSRNFRDKLAMRGRAADAGIPVPPFVGAINHQALAEFMERVPPPYVLKPRLQANAIGIIKVEKREDLWNHLERLGDQQSFFLLEKFIKGDICHVDSVIRNYKPLFACASRYGTPPMEVFHGGRVFTTRTLNPTSELAKNLFDVNQMVMKGLGLRHGVSHTEFILTPDNEIYFLETSARVGGAHISDMVFAATGVNLWREWAKLETTENIDKYKLKQPKKHFAALLNTLAKQEYPDLSPYNDKEVAWKLDKRQHAGLVIASPKEDRITELLDQYTRRFYEDFFVSVPAAAKASDLS